MAFRLCLFLACVLSFRLPRTSPFLKSSLPIDSASIRNLGSIPPPRDDDVSILDVHSHSGLVQILPNGSSMFYWFVQKLGSSPETDSAPLIIWLQGGPGCSSIIGNLFEFGPLFIDENKEPRRRNVTWASEFHLLFIDNPVGTGYSFAVGDSYVHTQEEMALNLYKTLQELCLKHSNWFGSREVYIFGESYAGKYIPHIASLILRQNDDPQNCKVHLNGIALGNGWTAPLIQTMSLGNYSQAAGLINVRELREVVRIQDLSLADFHNGELSSSNARSIDASNFIVEHSGNVNMYNVRQFEQYDFSAMVNWLNDPITKELLHVPKFVPFLECGLESYMALDLDEMLSVTPLFPDLLSHIRLLVYTGQDDLLCNVLGTSTYLEELDWEGKAGFHNATQASWYVSGRIAGYERKFGNLTQMIVLDAGHLVPRDQPQRTLDMVTRFIYPRNV